MTFVERIEEQAHRLYQLIVDLLHLSRVETGREAFDFRSLALRDAVRRCVSQRCEVARQRGVTLEVDDTGAT